MWGVRLTFEGEGGSDLYHKVRKEIDDQTTSRNRQKLPVVSDERRCMYVLDMMCALDVVSE